MIKPPLVETKKGAPPELMCAATFQCPAFLPIRVCQKRIERVVDLRFPAVGDWFARHFSTLSYFVEAIGWRIPYFPKHRPLKRFPQILPLILSQELGGGLFHHIVGNWLRDAGVNALIFPSARNDPSVKIAWRRQLHDFHGWILVDYRGAPESQGTYVQTDGVTSWPRVISLAEGHARVGGAEPTPCKDVGIEWQKGLKWRGSWRAWGLQVRVCQEQGFGSLWRLSDLYGADS